MAKSTFVLSVTGAGADLGAVAELDWLAPENVDGDGKLKSSFSPGEEAVFLVNSPPGYKAIDVLVHSKCGGGYIEPGSVSRERSESVGFDSESKSVDLQYWPFTAPVISLYTVPSTSMLYSLVQRTLAPATSEELPVEGIVEYDAECQQVRYIPPAGLELVDQEDVFPVRIEIVLGEI